ncbi:MAG: hypothetical protein PHI66_04285 [Candidatus Pacebacteria bacterium]|nr:hypothetical protein [Candidatus Paceibacterota bacterium]
MTKKKLKLIIMVLFVLASLAVIYFAFWSISKSKNGVETEEKNNDIVAVEIESGLLEKYKSTPDTLDSDGDGLLDKFEIILGTDKDSEDTDGDGYKDGEEIKGGYNPFSAVGTKFEEDFVFNSDADLNELFLIRQKLFDDVSEILCEDDNLYDYSRLADNDNLMLATENTAPCPCSKIKNSYYRNECFADIGAALSDLSLCNYITYGGNYAVEKDSCVFMVATRSQNAELCMDITGSIDKSNCLLNVAYEKKSYAICADITEAEIKDYCYYQIAISIKDKSLCEMMVDRGENHNICISESAAS